MGLVTNKIDAIKIAIKCSDGAIFEEWYTPMDIQCYDSETHSLFGDEPGMLLDEKDSQNYTMSLTSDLVCLLDRITSFIAEGFDDAEDKMYLYKDALFNAIDDKINVLITKTSPNDKNWYFTFSVEYAHRSFELDGDYVRRMVDDSSYMRFINENLSFFTTEAKDETKEN